jgi:S1-C subfamily serine protease
MIGIVDFNCSLLPSIPNLTPIIQQHIDLQYLPRSPEKIEQRAREVTVRVISEKNAASGILIDKRGSTYLVLTNKHVLQADNNIKVGTFDGKLYPANLVKSVDFQLADLALLSFQSNALYAAARLGKSSDLEIGEWVFSTGFPMRSQAWKFAEGQYILSTPQPMQYAYAFGYSSAVEKGMSGGPVMDAYGRVIAVNGVHANPLWGKPSYRYANGEKPCDPINEEMTNLSWAIPMETVIQFMPDLRAAPLEAVDKTESFPNPFASNRPLPSLLQKRAKLISKCVVPPLEIMVGGLLHR